MLRTSQLYITAASSSVVVFSHSVNKDSDSGMQTQFTSTTCQLLSTNYRKATPRGVHGAEILMQISALAGVLTSHLAVLYPFIHRDISIAQASSSPLLLRGAPGYSIDMCRS